jgi:hypothetical protein
LGRRGKDDRKQNTLAPFLLQYPATFLQTHIADVGRIRLAGALMKTRYREKLKDERANADRFCLAWLVLVQKLLKREA